MSQKTRMIALGKRPLMEGFALLGFEVQPDAELQQLERLLLQLQQNDEKALVLIESYLSRSASIVLEKIRKSGGKIVITEIPAIHLAGDYRPYADELVTQIMGHPDEK